MLTTRFARLYPVKLIGILLLVIPCTARGERLPLRSYTVADGLANNQINKIV